MTMQLKTYYKMCKHCGNDEGCDATLFSIVCTLISIVF